MVHVMHLKKLFTSDIKSLLSLLHYSVSNNKNVVLSHTWQILLRTRGPLEAGYYKVTLCWEVTLTDIIIQGIVNLVPPPPPPPRLLPVIIYMTPAYMK